MQPNDMVKVKLGEIWWECVNNHKAAEGQDKFELRHHYVVNITSKLVWLSPLKHVTPNDRALPVSRNVSNYYERTALAAVEGKLKRAQERWDEARANLEAATEYLGSITEFHIRAKDSLKGQMALQLEESK